MKPFLKKIFTTIFDKSTDIKKELIIKIAKNIPQPKKIKCALSQKDTWIFNPPKNKKIASQNAIIEEAKKTNWLRPKKTINKIEDILKEWEEINYITAEKTINSKDVYFSDGIYNSKNIFFSSSIFSLENILFGYNLDSCKYMVVSRGSGNCNFGIKVNDTLNCSNSFEVSWSYKITRSLFIHDCSDLYECMFCSHIYSKKYCIANMQFEKEEYFKIKKMVIEWIIKNLKNNNI